tara:strand:+ start:415 stop:582 length:168 start_codon:yes stop_codon:yes gene_type:complete
MSQIPKDTKKTKYNNNDRFIWVDAQLENFMKRQKVLEERIKELEKENEILRGNKK